MPGGKKVISYKHRKNKASATKYRVVSLRKNWAPSKHDLMRRMRIKFTQIAMRLADKIPLSKPYTLELLRLSSKRSKAFQKYENPTLPKDLRLEPIDLVYTDIYFLENFNNLAEGIERLVEECRDGFSIPLNGKDPGDWIRSQKNGLGGGNSNVGWINLQKIKGSCRPTLISDVHVQLMHISPSLIVASYAIKPTKLFVDEFENIVSEEARELHEVTRFHWKSGIRTMPPSYVKSVKFDDLFLSANAEFCRILRKYVGAGLAMAGPLMSIEVLLIDDKRSGKNAELPENASEEERDIANLFRCVGGLTSPYHKFKNGWMTLSPLDRRIVNPEIGYQIFVKKISYFEEYKERKSKENHRSTIRHHLAFSYISLLPMIAVVAFYKEVLRQILAARDEVYPILAGGGSEVKKLKKLKYGKKLQGMINGLLFKKTVVREEFCNSFVFDMYLRDIDGLKLNLSSSDAGKVEDPRLSTRKRPAITP